LAEPFNAFTCSALVLTPFRIFFLSFPGDVGDDIDLDRLFVFDLPTSPSSVSKPEDDDDHGSNHRNESPTLMIVEAKAETASTLLLMVDAPKMVSVGTPISTTSGAIC
jgi:hypothetical protein